MLTGAADTRSGLRRGLGVRSEPLKGGRRRRHRNAQSGACALAQKPFLVARAKTEPRIVGAQGVRVVNAVYGCTSAEM